MLSYQRGFYLTDLSIRYPYQAETISTLMLLVLVLGCAILFIVAVEFLRMLSNRKELGTSKTLQCMRNLGCSLACFGFGFIATYITGEVAKNSIRRLRPHFYDACQPELTDGSSWNANNEPTKFVQNYRCTRDLTPFALNELTLSFPSAHASLSCYSMLFLVYYLQMVWKRRTIVQRILRPVVQFLMLLLSWFISVSRVHDFWHHLSDVLAGLIIGAIIATMTALYVGRFFEKEIESLPTTRRGGVEATALVVSNKLKNSSLQHVPASFGFNQTLQQLQQQQQQQQQQQHEDQTSASKATLTSSSSLAAAKEHLISSNECVWQ